MAYTQAQIDRIKQQVALGVKKVKYGDKETEYITYAEAAQLISAMEAEVNPPSTFMNRRFMGETCMTLNRGRKWK